MPNHIAILSSLIVGLAATLGTIVIHGFAVHTNHHDFAPQSAARRTWPANWANMTFIMGATLIALAGHLLEIALWAFTLDICGAVPISALPFIRRLAATRLWAPTSYCRYDGSCPDHLKR